MTMKSRKLKWLFAGMVVLTSFQNCAEFKASDFGRAGGVTASSRDAGLTDSTSAEIPGEEPSPTPSATPTSTPAATPAPALKFYGRYKAGASEGTARFSWSGTSVRARFEGSAVSAKIKSDQSDVYFVAVIDGAKFRFKADAGEKTYEIKTGLSGGIHEILLMRDSEGRHGVTDFLGFELGPGGKLLAPAADAGLKLEFIGDSITCGYGNLGSSCSYSTATSSAYESYAQITARKLGTTPATQLCDSGHGVVRNYSDAYGTESADNMVWQYQYVQAPSGSSDRELWVSPTVAAHQPDVVVVNLGTNDAWDTQVPVTYEAKYKELLLSLRMKYPQALLIGTMGAIHNFTSTAIKNAIDALKKTGDTNVAYVQLQQMDVNDGIGCDFHPSARTHEIMADTLTAEIKRLKGLP